MTERCAGCGAPFDCRPGPDCWCQSIEARLPIAGSACLCPACLAASIAAAKTRDAPAK